MIRHDEHFLQLIHRHISLKRFSEIQELPFFYLEMPDKWMISPTQANLDALLEVMPTEIPLDQMVPFPEFSFILANDPSLHIVKLHEHKGEKILMLNDYFLPKSYNYSGIPDETSYKTNYDITPTQRKHIDKGVWIHYHVRTWKGSYGCIIQQMYRRKCKIKLNLKDHIDNSKQARQIFDRNNQDMEALMLSILALFHTAEEKHERLVHVAPDFSKGSNQRGKHHSSKYAAKHHYVYLDGPPATILTSGEASTIKRRGHHRRAHWHRLIHDRFKNHPEYGKRIRIKASWIGPKEWADAGKIYTLHEPEEL